MRALVLGASGFIGRRVYGALAAAGADVHAAVRPQVDLADAAQVRRVLHEVQPEVIFNLAGYGVDRSERDEAMAYRINAELVATVCGAMTAEQTLVHVGSALEYGEIGGNLTEESTPNPTTLYGKSKLRGTMLLKESGVRGVTARLFTVYGPGEHAGRLLPSLMEAARAGTDVELTVGTQKRDFTYVDDIVEGLPRLARAKFAPGEIVNLATGRLTSVRDFVEIAADVLGIPRVRLKFGAIATRAEEMEHEPVSVERLKRLTGWAAATWITEGVGSTWFAAFPR